MSAAAMLLYATRTCRTCNHPRNAHAPVCACGCDCYVDMASPQHTLLGETCRVCDEPMYADEVAWAMSEGGSLSSAFRELNDDANRPVHTWCVAGATVIRSPHRPWWKLWK